MSDIEDCLVGVSVAPVMEKHLSTILTVLNTHGFEHLTTFGPNATTTPSATHRKEEADPLRRKQNEHTIVCLDFHAWGEANTQRSYSDHGVLVNSIRSSLLRLADSRIEADNIKLEPLTREWADRWKESPDHGGKSRLAARILQTRQALQSPYPVLETHAHGERAIVRSVLHPVYGRAVLKAFRPGARPAAQREREALKALQAEGCVPRLLEYTDDNLLIEFIDDDGTHVRRNLPGVDEVQLEPWAVDQLIRLVERLRAHGLYVIDLASHNLMSAEGSLKLIDLEFCYEYEGPLPELVNDRTLLGTLPRHMVPESELFLIGTDTSWWNRVLLSAFHPAVTGATARRLLNGNTTRIEESAMQRFWYMLYMCLNTVRSFKRTVDSLRCRHSDRIGVSAGNWR